MFLSPNVTVQERLRMKAIYSIVLLNCPPCPSFESTLRDQAVPKRVGFLIYPAMRALDLVGTMDAFSAVTLADSKARRRSGGASSPFFW
jgi:hypothetical protein